MKERGGFEIFQRMACTHETMMEAKTPVDSLSLSLELCARLYVEIQLKTREARVSRRETSASRLGSEQGWGRERESAERRGQAGSPKRERERSPDAC